MLTSLFSIGGSVVMDGVLVDLLLSSSVSLYTICVGDVVLEWLLLLDLDEDTCIMRRCMGVAALFFFLYLIGVLDFADCRLLLFERWDDGWDGGDGSWYMMLEELVGGSDVG